MSDKTNVMPHNLEAEQAILGCLLIDNSIIPDVLEKLEEDDFYTESHQFILSAMKQVYYEHKPLDMVTLADKLDTEGNLAKAGGLEYLTDLTSAVPSSANYNHYFEIIRRDSLNRKLIKASKDIIKYAQGSDDELKSVQYAEELIYDISRRNDSSKISDIRESSAIDTVLDKFQKLDKDKNAYRGIQTGFFKPDNLTNGLQKSDLIVIAARPGMGKTSLSMNIVESAALKYDKVCAVFSLEMPETQIIQRLICSYANVSMSNALAGGGKLTPNDWKSLMKASEKLRKSRIYIDDSSRVTPAEILSKCRRIKAKNNGQLDLVMIDYIQLMSSGKKTSDQNRTQEVADITRELKIMAKELDVPVIALSQLRRMLTKEPQLSDLRESGAIEQDADIVMFINRPYVTATEEEIKKNNIAKDSADLIIAKHRNGGLDRIKLRFKGELTKFVNPEPDDNIEEPVYDYQPPADYTGQEPPPEVDAGVVFGGDEEAPF
ncbi:MAG: replicative DNA helicase [Candidatus Coproplasma sp.]